MMHQGYPIFGQSQIDSEDRDRRRSIRFPITTDLLFRVGQKSGVWKQGRTLNISSSGILIKGKSLPAAGSTVSVSLQWPLKLDNRVPLQLLVVGTVIRSVADEAAITFQKFEFRTARERAQTAVA